MKQPHIDATEILYATLALWLFLYAIPARAVEQTGRQPDDNVRKKSGYLEYIVENGDTIFVDEIRPSKVFPKLPKQKGKDWRRYYRLVHNFSKAYPYALVAEQIVMEADSTIEAQGLKGVKRANYIQKKQNELFKAFEKPLRSMTISQGALLMRLIDRETGKSSYNIIKDYKNKMAAGFWQGIAKLFGSDMKKNYDPDGDDRKTEELVKLWEDGDFANFYFSLFWDDMPRMKIPEEYRHLIIYY